MTKDVEMMLVPWDLIHHPALKMLRKKFGLEGVTMYLFLQGYVLHHGADWELDMAEEGRYPVESAADDLGFDVAKLSSLIEFCCSKQALLCEREGAVLRMSASKKFHHRFKRYSVSSAGDGGTPLPHDGHDGVSVKTPTAQGPQKDTDVSRYEQVGGGAANHGHPIGPHDGHDGVEPRACTGVGVGVGFNTHFPTDAMSVGKPQVSFEPPPPPPPPLPTPDSNSELISTAKLMVLSDLWRFLTSIMCPDVYATMPALSKKEKKPWEELSALDQNRDYRPAIRSAILEWIETPGTCQEIRSRVVHSPVAYMLGIAKRVVEQVQDGTWEPDSVSEFAPQEPLLDRQVRTFAPRQAEPQRRTFSRPGQARPEADPEAGLPMYVEPTPFDLAPIEVLERCTDGCVPPPSEDDIANRDLMAELIAEGERRIAEREKKEKSGELSA